MDKRYQVFVSSTFQDLQEERKEVMQALLELDCIPAGMELFPASNDDQWTLIKRVIDDCDYYLLIIGGRYGSISEQGISYTQMEFEYALETGKPIISFLHKNPDSIPMGKSEADIEKREKLEAFRQMAQKKLVKYWVNSVDLGSQISRSMIKLIRDYPAEGWVKSGSAVDEHSVHEIARLQRENAELRERLNRIATQAPEGTDKFAQGEDEIEIKYKIEATDDGTYDSKNYKFTSTFTWNELFRCVAPSMINECTDEEFRDNIRIGVLRRFKDSKMNSQLKRNATIKNIYVDLAVIDLIKVQFKALGLITIGDKKRSASDKQTYWKLTPYGEYVMTQLMAVRKNTNM